MAIISSYGTLTTVANPSLLAVSSVSTSGPFYDGYSRSYAEIYRTQPAVRTVVDFFARNIAQLGLHVFRRVSDTDRVRLVDHPLAYTIQRPNPSTTRYRFFESTVQDMGTYANAYWLKVRSRQFGLVRIPAGEMAVKGGLLPTGYEWTPASGVTPIPFAPSEVVHFRMYDPSNPLVGFPPIETLRQVLAEAIAAGAYREAFWKNSGRFESVIERPAGAKWTTEQKNEFRTQWQEFAGSRAGKTPILEDGMTLTQISFNARDSQYLESLKLSREFVAAQYHVPLPMVGILDHATFSNIREQHKQLYQDCLGPWLVNMEEEAELQLLPEFEDVENVYTEFNIAEKLKGSFEEQADGLTKMAGRPIITANEARARLNLPRDPDPDSDRLAKTAPGQAQAFATTSSSDTTDQAAQADAAALYAVLAKFAARQTSRLEKQPAQDRAAGFRRDRWSRELAADLTPLLGETRALALATRTTDDTHALLVEGAAPWPSGRVGAVVMRALDPEDARG